MASYYAQIDENNIVLQVLAVADVGVYNADGSDNEEAGIAFLKRHYPNSFDWKHTRFDGSNRKNFAGKGFIYDGARDAFIPPKDFASWVLNEETCQYNPPIPKPNDGKGYYWDEATVSWAEITK